MKDNTSPLFSRYILDGVMMEETPFSALYECLDGNGTVDVPAGPFRDIVDNYADKAPQCPDYDSGKIDEYVTRILRMPFNRKLADTAYPLTSTLASINALLLECIFKVGNFKLQDLLLMAKWDWFNGKDGNLAAFYDSTVGTGRYLTGLNVMLDRYFVEENRRECRFDISLRSGNVSSRRKCGDNISGNTGDWIIYIPFSNSRMNLGGSALSRIAGHDSGADIDVIDAGYFKDCYEVVRELVEDGVIAAGVSVGRGGLATAAERFRGRKGFTMDISGIMAAKKEKDIIRVLFSEIPGVLVLVKDNDFDYVDSQLVLQEVAYFPLGHPDSTSRHITLCSDGRNGVSGILGALLRQTSEGED